MRTRAWMPIVAALLGLCACSSAPAPATEAEKSDAMGAYQQCLHRNAAGLDDPATDAAGVARALAFACQIQREDVIATASRGLAPEDQARVRRQFEQDDPSRVTLMVLQRRAGIVR
jgi:hypothetical protein